MGIGWSACMPGACMCMIVIGSLYCAQLECGGARVLWGQKLLDDRRRGAVAHATQLAGFR